MIVNVDHSSGDRSGQGGASTDDAGANDLLPSLSVRHLQTFRALVDQGSFHAAAEALNYTQSSVSVHVAALEAALGVRLFERSRGRRTIRLTEAGEVLLGHVQAVLDRLRLARADMRALAAGSIGTLRVGTYQSVSAKIVPALLRRFSDRWPRVTVELREGPDDEELLGLLSSGTLDLAFSAPPPPDGPFGWVEILRDSWYLLTAEGSALAGRPAPLRVADLADEPLVAFRATGSAQAGLEAFMRGSGMAPRIIFRTDDNATVQGLVAAGFGAALFPALAIDMADPRVVRIPIDIPPRTIAITWHRDRVPSPAAESFVATAREVGGELAAAGR